MGNVESGASDFSTTLHLMRLIVTTFVALVLHLLLGWTWTILAGVVAGVWLGRRGWLVGGIGVGLSWLGLVGHNFAVAAEPVGRMVDTLGGILGNLPGFVVVAVTVLIGVLLGLVGGGLGTQLGLLVKRGNVPANA